MKFEQYKKQFDESFSKQSPQDFVQDMEKLGYTFTTTMKTYTFEKNSDNKWFVVLPEYLERFPGHEAELQMVFGADTMLDIMSEGSNKVKLTLSLTEFQGCDVLNKLNDTPDVGGAMYMMPKYRGIEYNLEMWLCGVTEFVFGHMPEKIYLS